MTSIPYLGTQEYYPLGSPWMTPTGACTGGSNEALWLLDSIPTAWGLFHNLDSCPLWVFIAGISGVGYGAALTRRGNSLLA